MRISLYSSWWRICKAYLLFPYLFLLPGQIQWVLNGQIVADKKVESIKQNAPNHPSDLSGRLLLGKIKFASQKWGSMKNKVTMLNVFSSILPIDKMQKLTISGEERCTLEGDYLSWTDMQWTLHGGTSNQTLTKEDVCTPQGRTFNFFGGPFPGVQACAEHCAAREDEGGRYWTYNKDNRECWI